MSFGLRAWLFAVTILLLADDFQYLLKIENTAFEQILNENETECPDGEESEEGKEENTEKKEEKKEKDDDNNIDSNLLLHTGTLLARHKFSDVLAPLSAIAHELESPPPEV